MQDVFINYIATYLPNQPITNDAIEDRLGKINGRPSRAKAIVLRNNKIVQRYYALNEKGQSTHTNTQLTYQAIQKVLQLSGRKAESIAMLSCGTSTPDQWLPSHASMVHGALQNIPMEINSASGICTSGMNALKYAFMAIRSGCHPNAISTGSERVSSWLRAEKFKAESDKLEELQENPMIGFEKDFLRWMLSDGAGAMLLSDQPNQNGDLSLKMHWIDGVSYANELETCMYAGAMKVNGELVSWSDLDQQTVIDQSVFAIKQDIKLLEANIIQKGVQSCLSIAAKHGLELDSLTYFLPHISSFVFKDKLFEAFKAAGYEIPADKWFINLDRVGNVGAASIYLQLEELVRSGMLQSGQKILLSVPESGRFSYVYALLEVH
jgi:3-oxoacyl-[acyl-carrier-protein] synthase-3